MNARILIVEDDQIIQFDLRQQLKRLGHTVVGGASSGEEALAKTEELKPDLVLMDIRLRGAIGGMEAAREIRARRDVPIIFLSAQSGAEMIGALKNATEPWLTKPFDPAILARTIESVLETQRSQLD